MKNNSWRMNLKELRATMKTQTISSVQDVRKADLPVCRMFERPVYPLLFEFHHSDIQGTGQNSQPVKTALKRLLNLET